MEKKEKIKRVINILESSDIVWGQYGTDTIEELAQRIVGRLEDEDN